MRTEKRRLEAINTEFKSFDFKCLLMGVLTGCFGMIKFIVLKTTPHVKKFIHRNLNVPNMKNLHFGENLRMLRIYKNVCQEGMAAGLNISQTSYSRIESSPAIPETQLIAKLADTLGVKPEDLLSGNWYMRALNDRYDGSKRSVVIINRGGQIAYGVLLASATWDSIRGIIAGAKTESIDVMIFIGLCLTFCALLIYQRTVKHVKIVEEEE